MAWFATVTAATGALGPVLVKLTALLGDDYKLLQEGTRQDIMSIKSKLEPVHDLLKKLWGREDLDVACKDWMMEARELSYDMEDDINTFALRLERGDGGGLTQQEATDGPFKKFMERVKSVSKRCGEMYKIGDTICNLSKLTTDPRALFLHKDASELVGMEDKEEELIKLLQEHEMVCVVGYAGMGKTTLADVVYHAIADEFQCRAFVSVHPRPNMMEILGTILSQVTNGASSSWSKAAASEQNIIQDISIFLSDKRYLVIIDDIWDWEEWEVIRKALPRNNLGCKIIMTTRINSIAGKCKTEQGAQVYTHELQPAEAIRLSVNRLITKPIEGGYRLKEHVAERLSTKIVDMCGAIPLAVVCLSSEWAVSHGEWNWNTWKSHVLDKFLSIPSLKPLVQSLCLGFDDLPVQLRTCLLYCSIYNQHDSFERDCLIRKWIAEGLVPQQEVAEAYFDEMLSRNLLQPERGNAYTVKPIMHAFLVCKAKEEKFVACRQYSGPGSSSHGKQQIRRLSLYTDHYPDEDVSHTRTLAVFGPQPPVHGIPFKKFKNLRVLEIDGACLEDHHLVDICGLIWLRYLGINGCPQITKLPPDIGRMLNLEFLYVRTGLTELPKEIENLQHLETLDACNTKVAELPREIGKLQKLRTLNVSQTCVTELPREIGKLQQLRTLNISQTGFTELPREIMELHRLENLDVSRTRVRELPKELGKLQHLRTLDITETKVTELPWEVTNSVLVSVCVSAWPLDVSPNDEEVIKANSSREDLSILVLFNPSTCEAVLPFPMFRVAGRHLNVPQWVKHDLSNVSSLDIRLCKLESGDLEFLQQMPNLKALQLRLEVLPQEPIAITSEGFSELEVFDVDSRMPRVTFLPGAMPKLKYLEFKFYSGRVSQDYSMGIEHLDSIETIVFRCSEYYSSDAPGIRKTIDGVRKEAADHPNEITICVNDMDPEVFSSGDKWISHADKAFILKRERLRLAAESRAAIRELDNLSAVSVCRTRNYGCV